MVIRAEGSLVRPGVLRCVKPMLRLILCQRDVGAGAHDSRCSTRRAPSQPAFPTRGGLPAGAVHLICCGHASARQHLVQIRTVTELTMDGLQACVSSLYQQSGPLATMSLRLWHPIARMR